jgi:hypothetical protein
LDDFIRTTSVTHDVAQIHHPVIGWRGGQAGLKRLEVAMDVAEQK